MIAHASKYQGADRLRLPAETAAKRCGQATLHGLSASVSEAPLLPGLHSAEEILRLSQDLACESCR